MRIESSIMARTSARRTAFTLMEVLVVVAILVVLAGVGGVIYMRIQEDANRDLARVQAKEIETAIRSYERQYREFPPTLMELAAPSDGTRPYLQQDRLIDPWGQPFNYNPQPQQQTNVAKGVPDIFSAGPDRSPGTADDVGNW